MMSQVSLEQWPCLMSACVDRYPSLLPCQRITVCMNMVTLWQRWQAPQAELGRPEMRRDFSTVPAQHGVSDVS